MIAYFVIGLLVAFLNYKFRSYDTNEFTDFVSKKPTYLCMFLWVLFWPLVAAFLLWDVIDSDIWMRGDKDN